MNTNLRQIAELPTPKRFPFLGQTFQINPPKFHQQLEQWSRELGDYYRLQIGLNKYLVISDHQAISKALRDRPDGFSRSARLPRVWIDMRLKIGVFGAEGDVWRKQRRMVMAAFDPTHVKAYFPAMCKVADRLENRWKKSVGTDVDLAAELMRFTVDTITGLAFGQDVNSLESDDDIIQAHLDKIFPALFKRILAPFEYWHYIKLPKDHRLDRSIAEVNAAIDGFVVKARQRMKEHPELREAPSNLLEAMISAADSDGGLNDDDVAGNVLTMLLAGEDTTANSLAWMLSLLWANPATLKKLQEEIRSKFDPDTPYSMEQLGELDYLDACINESMRLKPVAPLIGLQALKDTTIGDINIPNDTLIFAIPRRDGIDERHVPNASKFDPERWMENEMQGNNLNSAKRISNPFGAGPRICPGRYLALLEMKIAMTMLFTRFDIEDISAPNKQEPQEHMAFTLVPLGLKMRLKMRN